MTMARVGDRLFIRDLIVMIPTSASTIPVREAQMTARGDEADMGEIHDPESLQVSGVIRIPRKAVIRQTALKEKGEATARK